MAMEGKWQWRANGDGGPTAMEGQRQWKANGNGVPMAMEGQWQWRANGNGGSMAMEGQWQWVTLCRVGVPCAFVQPGQNGAPMPFTYSGRKNRVHGLQKSSFDGLRSWFERSGLGKKPSFVTQGVPWTYRRKGIEGNDGGNGGPRMVAMEG